MKTLLDFNGFEIGFIIGPMRAFNNPTQTFIDHIINYFPLKDLSRYNIKPVISWEYSLVLL